MGEIDEQLRHKDVQEMTEQEIREVFTFDLTNEEIDPDFKRIAEMFLSVLKENADQRQQLQQERERAEYAEAVLHSDARLVKIRELENTVKQAQATIAAMRVGLTMMRKHVLMYGKQKSDTGMIYDTCRQLLESTTAGAELLEKIERLERENKALRCCGNCEYGDFCGDMSCYRDNAYKDKEECLENDFDNWQIAEGLVSKGE